MNTTLVSLVVVTSAAVTPDVSLVAALGAPEFTVREWAQTKLEHRAKVAVYPPAVVACVNALWSSPDYEIRARAARVIHLSTPTRVARALFLLDVHTGCDYPCIDALIVDPRTGQYDYDTDFARVLFRNQTRRLPDFSDKPNRLFYDLRARTRCRAAQALADGWDLESVLAELERMHRIDAAYSIRNGLPFDGPLPAYVLTAFRWDTRPRPLVVVTPPAFPMAMPANP